MAWRMKMALSAGGGDGGEILLNQRRMAENIGESAAAKYGEMAAASASAAAAAAAAKQKMAKKSGE